MPSIASLLQQLTDDPLEALTRMAPSDLRRLMLPVLRARAEHVPLRAIREAAARDLRFAPSPLDARELHAIEGLLWRAVPDAFDALALGPVLPLGAHHQLAGTPQDNVLSATRASEVLGDPTVALALRAAARRARGEDLVRLATASRPVRMQPLTDPSHTRHFGLFALLSSARVQPSDAFEIDALAEHLGAWTRLATLAREAGHDVLGVSVRLTDMRLVRGLAARHGVELDQTRWQRAAEALAPVGLPRCAPRLPTELWPDGPWAAAQRVDEALRARLPGVNLAWDLGRTRQATYYTSFAFHVLFEGPHGALPLADGGFVDWVGRLTTNARERTLTSGLGHELLGRLFPRTGPGASGCV